MRLLRGKVLSQHFPAGVVATVGNFDGVHLGHQALLRALCQKARNKNLPSVVILFEPQPSEYFCGAEAPARLSRLREKWRILAAHGIDYVLCLRFDQTLASYSAEDFAHHFIFSTLNVKSLLIGDDFKFGRQRLGDIHLLQKLAPNYDATVEVFPDFFIEGQRASSTRVRKLLEKGHLSAASQLLGRPYQIVGRVVHGDERGRLWGIPTANIPLYRITSPLKGVFAVEVSRQNGSKLQGVANVGCRPTITGKSKPQVEVHLFDFNETIYGELLTVSFVHKLRDEIKFSSVEALVQQIKTDITMAKTWYKEQALTE